MKIKRETVILIIFIVCCILILLIIGCVSGAAIYQEQANKCAKSPSPWCYKDWMCLSPNGAPPRNMSEAALFGAGGVITACAPIDEKTIIDFVYSAAPNNNIVTGHPGLEKNIWDNSCLTDTTHESCPFYTVGDIYWRACHGASSSPYYTITP
jgi:hypothetical protein